MNICIIGLGLLGGSFSLGLKLRLPDIKVTGVDLNEEHCRQAISLGIADEIRPLDEAVQQAELVVLATPVNSILQLLVPVLDKLPEGSVLMDLGSTKEQLCRAVENHPKRARFVAAHPIAGTEYSGPTAAFAQLLHLKTMIIVEKEKSSPGAVQLVEGLCHKLEMPLRYMPAREHDLHLAYVSHLSHISSFALGITVLEKEKDEEHLLDMAGSGFSSTVRLAKSSAQMWSPIFSQNASYVSEALHQYIHTLEAFKQAIDRQDQEASSQLIKRANAIGKILT